MPFINGTWTEDAGYGYGVDSPLTEGNPGGWIYNENAMGSGWTRQVPSTNPTLDATAIQNLTPYTINTDTAPGESRFEINPNQPAATDPNAYYSQLASDLASKIWENNAANAGGRNTGYIDSLNSIKAVNPVAYYSAQIQLLASEAGHAAAMGETSRQQTAQQQLQALLPQALQAGVSSTQANSVANSSYADGAGLGSRIKSQAAAGSGFWKDNLIGALKVGALAMGAYGLDTALAAGAAGAEAGAAGSGGAFTPTAGSSFAIDPSATYTTSGLLGGGTTATTGATGMEELFGPTYQELGYTGLDAGQMGPSYADLGFTGLNQDAAITAADAAAAAQSGISTSQLASLAKQYGVPALKALLGTAAKAATGTGTGTTAGGLLGAAGNYALNQYQLGQLSNAYNQSVAAQQSATQTAQQQASFKPVGITTAFGQSNFQFDPATGQMTSAGYTPTSQVAGQVQNLMGLGAQALPTTADTSQIQQNYIAQQQGLLAPGREQQLASTQNKLWQTGRTGLATGGTTAGYAAGQPGLMQTNPELAAYYNSIGQQDAQITANAPTYAQNLLNSQIATGTGLFGAANTLEGYAQQPLSLSSGLGTAAATAGNRAGFYGLLGTQQSAATQLQGQLANITGTATNINGAVNPLISAAGNAINQWLA